MGFRAFRAPGKPGISTFLYMHGPACQAIGTQFGARQRRRTPTIHRGGAQPVISAGSFDEIQQAAGRDVGNAGQDPGPRAAGRTAMAAVAIVASRAARNNGLAPLSWGGVRPGRRLRSSLESTSRI